MAPWSETIKQGCIGMQRNDYNCEEEKACQRKNLLIKFTRCFQLEVKMGSVFSELSIERTIIHQIFKRLEDKTPPSPKLNTTLTVLDKCALDNLQDRMINVLGVGSHCIEMQIDTTVIGGTFQTSAKMIYDTVSEFISHSHHIVRKLIEAQSRRDIPGGVIVCFTGKTGETRRNYCCIIKAEIHEGFEIESAGQQENIVRFLSNLFLTPSQKLYKIGIFIEKKQPADQKALRSADEFEVYIYDHMLSKSDSNKAAHYFYAHFLGCIFKPSDKTMTRDFYHHTRNFINGIPGIDDEQRFDLLTGLYSYVKTKKESTINPSAFAEDYFGDSELRDGYENYLLQKEIPCQAFQKNTELLKNDLKRRSLLFSSDVKISAPSEVFKNSISFIPKERLRDFVDEIEKEEDTTLIKVKGKVLSQK